MKVPNDFEIKPLASAAPHKQHAEGVRCRFDKCIIDFEFEDYSGGIKWIQAEDGLSWEEKEAYLLSTVAIAMTLFNEDRDAVHKSMSFPPPHG